VKIETDGLSGYFSKAYSTATQQASLPVLFPWALKLARVGKKASHAGQGCISSSADVMLVLVVLRRRCERRVVDVEGEGEGGEAGREVEKNVDEVDEVREGVRRESLGMSNWDRFSADYDEFYSQLERKRGKDTSMI
jgi:hypothetical protein